MSFIPCIVFIHTRCSILYITSLSQIGVHICSLYIMEYIKSPLFIPAVLYIVPSHVCTNIFLKIVSRKQIDMRSVFDMHGGLSNNSYIFCLD